ncbi:MAG: hypothetical protein R3B70_05830 [Polyangiaceae bacterium]
MLTMSIRLVVEFVNAIDGRTHVFARVLDRNAKFHVTPGVLLNECAIEPWLTQPRALDAAGQPRFDLFAFCLKKSADSVHFQEGATVQLTLPEVEPASPPIESIRRSGVGE